MGDSQRQPSGAEMLHQERAVRFVFQRKANFRAAGSRPSQRVLPNRLMQRPIAVGGIVKARDGL